MSPTILASRARRAAARAAVIGAAAALALSACSTADEPTTGTETGSVAPAPDASAFPVTVSSALGDAVIESQPERVVTWGWSAQDAVLALGIVPVAMPGYTYGGDADAILPWDAEAIAALGGEKPQILSGADTGEIPFEEIVAASPDVILAPYSGLTQDEFDKLSQIAPTVAYPDQPWATSWQDQTALVGKALGRSAEAAALVEKNDAYVAGLAAKYPVLKDVSFLYGANNQADQFNIYRADDPRVELLVQLGMVVAPSVAALDAQPDVGTFFYTISFENLVKVDADVLVAYFGDQASADAFVADPLVAAMPQVAEGRFAPIVGESFVMASSAPSVLSIPWMLDRYVPELAEAAANVQ